MIWFFPEGMKPSVRAQLDARVRDLNSWKEAVEKAVNAEAKIMLQSFSSIYDIDSRCPRGNKLAKKKKKTPVERISLPPLPLLARLVENSPFPLSKLLPPTQRRTRTISKEVLGAEEADKDRAAATTPLQWVLTPTPSRRKWKMFPKLSATTVIGRDITPPCVPKGQKNSIGLSGFYAGDWN